MLIELVDNFRGKKIGDVIDWPDHMARILIEQKRAVAVKEKIAASEKALEAAPVDKMMRKTRIRRKS